MSKPIIFYGMYCVNCDKEFESVDFDKTDAWECGCDEPDLHALRDYKDADGNRVEPDGDQYD